MKQARPLLAEFLGSLLLAGVVIGSGILALDLSGGNIAVALIGNTAATGAILWVLVATLGPISGAHFNPVVTFAFLIRREIDTATAAAFIAVQIAGGVMGVWLTHVMFDLTVLQFSTTARTGTGQWVSEVFATFGLLFVIFGGLKSRPEAVPTLVALYITGAYWFTSSTSFANPAVTIARGLTDTFAGINPAHVLMFILMQIVGVVIAAVVLPRLLRS